MPHKIPVQTDFFPVAFYGFTTLNAAWNIPSPSKETAQIFVEEEKSNERIVPIRSLKKECAKSAVAGVPVLAITSSVDDSLVFDGLNLTNLESASIVIRGFTPSRPLCSRCCKRRRYGSGSKYCYECYATLKKYES